MVLATIKLGKCGATSSGSGCDEVVVGQPPRLDHLPCLSDDDDEEKDDDNVLVMRYL